MTERPREARRGNQKKTMRILLQHVPTRRYFRSLEGWTANPIEAFDFQHSLQAIDFAAQNQLQDVQLVVRFPDDEAVAVPLPLPTVLPEEASLVA